MSIIRPAADTLEDPGDAPSEDYIKRLEHASIEQSLANLMTFGAVRRKVADQSLHLHGAYFGVASGKLLIRDPDTKAFIAWTGDHVHA